MAAELEEVVVDADALQPQHLGEQCAQHLLLRRARQTPHVRRGEVRRRQRLAVELAVGRERKLVQRHERRRHHVVRQARTEMRPQRRGVGNVIGAGHHVSHQALVARLVLARDDGGLCHRRMPHQRRLDLAGLDAEAAYLHLPIGAPEEVEHSVRAPAHQIAGAVHAAARRTERVGHEPLGRQPRAPEIAARQSRARDVKLAGDSGRHRLQASVQNVHLRVPDRTADRHCSVIGIAGLKLVGRAAARRFSWAVVNNDLSLRDVPAPGSNMCAGHAFAADHDAMGQP